ncbi:MAG: hypothetical protein QOF78_3975, partial [Phycisphaerales bacterium]|nr:hypothetical protein [Phycisphaerales bacterium]
MGGAVANRRQGKRLTRSFYGTAGYLRPKLFSEPLEPRRLLAAAVATADAPALEAQGFLTPTLVQDLSAGSNGSGPGPLLDVNGTLFFTANTPQFGTELWKINANTGLPELVKDLLPGPTSSWPSSFLSFNGTLLFWAGGRMWKSDGTEAGTTVIKELPEAQPILDGIASVGAVAYYSLIDQVHGRELWRTDGTAEGTYLLKDINPGSAGSTPNFFTRVGRTLFFRANDGNGLALWKTDGSASGTVKVAPVFPHVGRAAVGSTFVFAGSVGPETHLWRSDGTPEGTYRIRDDLRMNSGYRMLGAINGYQYFAGSTAAQGIELWRTDGTSSGTTLVKDILPGTGSSSPGYPDSGFSSWAAAAGSVVVFVANDGVHGREVWRTDGTASGTFLVKDIRPNTESSNAQEFTSNGGAGGTVFFRADDGVQGSELWQSDGTAAGTFLVHDINAGSASATPSMPVTTGGASYFAATDAVHGRELWVMRSAKPDLVVQNVVFDKPSVTAGDTFAVSFRIKNLGGAAPATQARLRLSSDANLTLYDKPLSPLDVNIPPIPAGGYYDYTGPFTVPAGTTAGSYYVGVFADRDNRAGQSNITNDAGLSATTLTVTAPAGVVAPQITRQPTSLTVQAGAVGELSVLASGTGPLTYKWFHDGRELLGETASILSFRNAAVSQRGSYFVRVSNAADIAVSATAQLTVTPALVPPPIVDLSALGRLVSYLNRPLDPSRPTVVITHGFQPGGDYSLDPDQPLREWMTGMQAAINLRLEQGNRPANVLAFVWRKAFTSATKLLDAKDATPAAGTVLANLLAGALGAGYAQDLHLIGHSLGTAVNAEAVSQLKARQIDVEQVTILDAPMKAGSLLPKNAQLFPGQSYVLDKTLLFDSAFFHNRMPGSDKPYGVDWVDNYFGVSTFAGAAFGTWIPGAAPHPGGRQLLLPHNGIVDWYIGTIPAGGAREGFEHSVLLGSDVYLPRPDPIGWYNDPNLLEKVIYEMPTAISTVFSGGGWVPTVGSVTSSAAIAATQQTTALLMWATGQNRTSSVPSLATEDPAVIAAASLDMVVPRNASAFCFEYKLENASITDEMVVSFNGLPVMTLRGDCFTGVDYKSAVIPMPFLAGEVGMLE